MTQRLPIPGGDVGTWGSLLNGFLGVAHNSDGTLNTSAVSSAGAEMTSNKNQPSGYAGLDSSGFVPVALLPANIPLSDLSVTGTASSSNYLRGDGTWSVPPTASNATTGAPGLVQLAGDLGGTSTSATAPTLANTSNVQSVVNTIIGSNSTVTGALQKTGGTMSGAIAMGSNKITGLTNGSASSDAAAYGQIPTSLPPSGTAGGDLTGNYPNPTLSGTTNVESIITANATVAGAVPKSTVTTAGDLIVGTGAGTVGTLAAVATGNVLSSNGVGAAPVWAAPAPITTSTATNLTGILTGSGTVVGSITKPTGAVVGISDTQTLTNKRWTRRVLALSANSATPSINTDSYDVVNITAQTAAITSFTSGLTGTPVDGDLIRISITGTAAVALTWGSKFEASTVALPTTTVTTARLDVGFFWNTASTAWRCVAVA